VQRNGEADGLGIVELERDEPQDFAVAVAHRSAGVAGLMAASGLVIAFAHRTRDRQR
jgi:hypothetical protein